MKFYQKGKNMVRKELDIVRLVKMERKITILTNQITSLKVKFQINNTNKAVINMDESSEENDKKELKKDPDINVEDLGVTTA